MGGGNSKDRRRFTRATELEKERRQRRERRDRAFAVILAIATFVLTYFLRVELAAIACAIGLFFIADLIGNSERLARTRARTIRAVQVVAFLVGTIICIAFLYPYWIKEQAAKNEGNLLGGPSEAFTDGQARATPWLAIGGTVFLMTPNAGQVPYLKPFYDSQFEVEWGKKGPLISTAVRDYHGNLVAQITNNHWQVFPRFCLDKNYTNNTLEVKDDSGHVVLQVILLAHGGGPGPKGIPGVELQGEWWNNEGKGVRLIKRSVGDHGADILPLTVQNQHENELITPICEYPSSEHWQQCSSN